MIKLNSTFRQQADFAMPAYWTASGRPLASVCALPTVGGVSAAATGARVLDGTAVFGDHITGTAVRTGAFPGLSAWSPPI